MIPTEEQRGTAAFDLEKAREAIEEAVDRLSQKIGDEDGPIWEKEPEKAAVLQTLLDEIAHLEKWMIKNRDAATELQYQLDDAVKENERLRAIIDTPSEEPEWVVDFKKLNRFAGVGYSLIDIEIAKKWHTAYRKAQNSNLLRKQEIERLRASLIDLHAEYINTLEKNPECSAWDLDEQSDADQKRLRRNAAHAISIVEPPIYLQAEQRATKIKELEDALVEERVIGEGGFRAEQCEFWYIEDLLEESCMELDGLCDWAKCPRKHELCDVAYQQLAEEGKIGPDADAKPQVWQITEERRDAIMKMSSIRTIIFCPDCGASMEFIDIVEPMAVLRGMLEEADHDKP